MAFPIPELIVENVIRNGFTDLKNNPAIIDQVFENFSSGYAARKYGAPEFIRLKNILTGANATEIAIVHAFHLAEGKNPAVSLSLGSQAEATSLARLGDFEESLEIALDATELAALVKEVNVIPSSYDSVTGQVIVPDSVDLLDVFKSYIYMDGSGVEHTLLPGISNQPGDKFFFIAKNLTPDITNPGSIKSFLTTKILEQRGVTDDITILIGVHGTEPLLVKYLFILLQFFLLSRKEEMINNCLIVSSISGSDFNPDVNYLGDKVFTRFLSLHGKIESSFDSSMFNLIDNVTITGIPVE